MNCAWDSLLAVVPPRLRQKVDNLGREYLLELRLRKGQRAELVLKHGIETIQEVVGEEDIRYVVNTASNYSPWSASTVANGYITAPGGHRIGLCGECVVKDGTMTGTRTVSSLCIRVARNITGIANGAPLRDSLLILGPPGAGKTTLLRDLIRLRSNAGCCIAGIDERAEIFPDAAAFPRGPRTDVLTGCSKRQGVQIALRTMGPSCIAVDEITSAEDCCALADSAWCGVELLATAHATDCRDLRRRKIYEPLYRSGLFTQAIVLSADKTWRLERMEIWASN